MDQLNIIIPKFGKNVLIDYQGYRYAFVLPRGYFKNLFCICNESTNTYNINIYNNDIILLEIIIDRIKGIYLKKINYNIILL